jgi:threonine synthase
VTRPASRLVCAGCGAVLAPSEPYPFRCPDARRGDDVDHVVRRTLDLAHVRFPLGLEEPNPFVRYRELLHAYHVARAGGMRDGDFVSLVRRLDDAVRWIDDRGFEVTPFSRSDALSEALGFSTRGGVWVKDETGGVSGSHKARHLFGVLLHLEVAEHVGLVDSRDRRELAVASCGNAALAAAIVAAATGRELRVFVPVDADEAVLARLEELGAHVEVCERAAGVEGDPTYARLLEALEAGALPFTCQGNLNGLAVEGGMTLGWELASELAARGQALDRLVVQVGGGALASACFESLREAAGLGALEEIPRLDTVQTASAWPLRRAFEAVRLRPDGLAYAMRHRSEFMWPWENAPRSVAHGIVDDETYDWVAVVEGMLATGGVPLVAGEEVLRRANALARETTGIDVDPTGSAGLAGVMALRADGVLGPDERVAVLFTGVVRTEQPEERSRDEKLSRTRHPVAQGLRAG